MQCEQIEILLSPYLEDELGDEDRAAVEIHLKACPSCASLCASLKEVQASFVDFPEPEMSRSLFDRLHAIPFRKRRLTLSLDFIGRPSLQPVLAAASVLMMLVSFYAFNPNRPSIERSISRQIHLGYSKAERLFIRAESFATSLGEFKDNILVSLENIGIFRKEQSLNQSRYGGHHG